MDIKFEIKNNTGLIILNRPKSLNALNLKMAQDFALKLEEWKNKNFLKNKSGWITAQSDNPFVNGWYFEFSKNGSVGADHLF